MIVTIFRSRLLPEAVDEYMPVAKRMSDLAKAMPGYIDHKGFVAEDGERLTVVEFDSGRELAGLGHSPRARRGKEARASTIFHGIPCSDMQNHPGLKFPASPCECLTLGQCERKC